MAQGTGTPKVITNVSSNNLQRQVVITDGVPGLVATASTVGLIGVVNTVYSLPDAETKGYTEAAEPYIHKILTEFYTELGGSMELWILGVEDSMTMTQAVTSTNANGAKKLLTQSLGKANIIGIGRKPAGSYNGGTAFLDSDVATAVTASKSLGEYQQSINRPCRFLIEGRVVNSSVANAYNPNSATNGFAGVVLGGSTNDGAASVGLALARAVKYPAHVKIGSGANGVLTMTSAYIGTKKIEEFTPSELDAFANAGFIVFHIREGISGYFFGRDNMCTNDDFTILVHGRLIDKAQRIAAATTTSFLETSIRITKEGLINDADAAYLEQTIKSQIRAQMSEQISNLDVIVPTDQDLINTSTVEMQVKIQPFGYMTWIVVNLGLTQNL